MTGPQRKPRRGSLRADVLALLADGRPRTSTEILRAIAADLDTRVRNTLHDLKAEGNVRNHRRSPEEGLWTLNQGDDLPSRSPVSLPERPRTWCEL